MPEQKKRVFNYRPMVVAALAMAGGILLSAIANLGAVAFIVTACVLVVAAVAIIVVCRKRKRIIGIVLLLLLGFVGYTVDYAVSVPDTMTTEYAEIAGRVCAYGSPRNGEVRFYMDSCQLDGSALYGKVEVHFVADADVSDYFAIGDLLTIYASVETVEYDPFDTVLTSYDRNDVRYTARLKTYVQPTASDLKLTDKVKARLSTSLYKVLGDDESGVALSLLFGDKSQLEYADYSVIKAAGLAHIFAVSGLHLGFLVAVLTFILKKAHVNATFTLFIVTSVLLLYGVLCGFPASLVRALVMTIVVLGARALKQRPDPLTSLATAVFALLLFNPTTLFDVGFLMSVSAVGGIVLFAAPIAKKLKKIVKFRVVSQSVAMSVSSTAGLFPVMANVFNSFSVYFVVANLICLPLVSLLFTFLLAAFVLCIVSPALAFSLYPAKYLIKLLLIIAEGISVLPFATVGVLSMGAIAVVYVVTLVNLSRFNMLPTRDKTIATVASACISVFLYIVLYGATAIISV